MGNKRTAGQYRGRGNGGIPGLRAPSRPRQQMAQAPAGPDIQLGIPQTPLEMALETIKARELLAKWPDHPDVINQLNTLEQLAGGHVFKIAPGQYEELEKRVAKLQRKADKMGIGGVKFRLLAEDTEIVDKNGRSTAKQWQYIAASADPVTLQGWQMVGVLEWDEEQQKTLVQRVPGGGPFNTVPWRNAPPDCDHCQLNRKRHSTYLVKDTASGDIKQVGSSCLQDFTGHQSPEQLARWAASIADFYEEMERAQRGAYGAQQEQQVYPTEEYLAQVAAEIRRNGWYSRSRSYNEGGQSTAYAALDDMYNSRSQPPTAADYAEAKAAMAWVADLENKPQLDDYEHNLVVSVGSDHLTHRRIGLAASAVAGYQRSQRQAAQQAQAANSRYIGQPKDKITDMPVTIKRHATYPGDYGTRHQYLMEDDKGNQLVWWATREALPTTPGSKVKITGTIKAHKEYKNVQQTVLTRVKEL